MDSNSHQIAQHWACIYLFIYLYAYVISSDTIHPFMNEQCED